MTKAYTSLTIYFWINSICHYPDSSVRLRNNRRIPLGTLQTETMVVVYMASFLKVLLLILHSLVVFSQWLPWEMKKMERQWEHFFFFFFTILCIYSSYGILRTVIAITLIHTLCTSQNYLDKYVVYIYHLAKNKIMQTIFRKYYQDQYVIVV